MKMSPQQIISEVLHCPYYGEKLFIGGTILPLGSGECFGGVRDNNPSGGAIASILFLLKYGTNAIITGVRREKELAVARRVR